MARIIWDGVGEKIYETGVDHGVLYPIAAGGAYSTGVPWNGLTGVTESSSGAESTPQYADNIKYLNILSAEEFGATIEAFTYPPEFMQCDGSAEIAPGVVAGQQTRRNFGFCYRTLLGNDTENVDFGYKLHLVYNATASPSEKAYSTVNESPEPITFSWEITTTPVPISSGNYRPTASITIDSTIADPAKLSALEDILYGTTDEEARLPLPDEIRTLMAAS